MGETQLLDRIIREVEKYKWGGEQEDDYAMVLMEVLG